MANTIYMMESANLFAGDTDPTKSNHLSLNSLKLPGMEENYSDHNAGGSRVGVEVDTHFNKLEATFNLMGWTPDVLRLIGSWSRTDQRFTAYGLIRDRRTGSAIKATAIMWGRLGRANPTEFTRGNVQQHEYSIRGITHYELTMGDTPLIEWDFFTNTLIIGGVNMNAETNAILSIANADVAPGGQQIGGGQGNGNV
jgi:P2 family phage contractile tail tube protein